MENNRKSANELNALSALILQSALAVHREMGPGLLETVYEQCMIEEIRSQGILFKQQVPLKLYYKSKPLEKDFVVDILVENEIILELKAVESLLKVHEAQLISYLKLTNRRLGFLINFNVPLLKDGFKRFVNKL